MSGRNRTELTCFLAELGHYSCTSSLPDSNGAGGMPSAAADGYGMVAFLNLRHGSYSGNNEWVEYAGACLTSPLLQGTMYTLSVSVAAPTKKAWNDPDGLIDVLCLPSCNSLPLDGRDGKEDSLEVLATGGPVGNLVVGGGWLPVTLEFTPTQDCEAILIGGSAAGAHNSYTVIDALNLQVRNLFKRQILTSVTMYS